ncbi:MAG: thioesterase family protein [Actinomycetota bacterium]
MSESVLDGASSDPSDDSRPVLWEPAGDDRWRPVEHSRGPWSDVHCHGGPVAALLARACERSSTEDDGGVEWQHARITIELMRPVEVDVPLELTTDVERPGRKVSLVAARLSDGDRTVAMARSLRIAQNVADLPEHREVTSSMVAGPDGVGRTRSAWDLSGDGLTAFHRDAVEMRFVSGTFDDAGPVQVWMRLLVDVVPGETPTPFQRVASCADFGNGVSGALPSPGWTYINPDLTIHLARAAQGEWVGLDSHSIYGVDGVTTGSGFAESALHDQRGPLGRSVQSLLVART